MINVVIFSKDRPAQLELLLRSMKRFFVELSMVQTHILYKYTNDEYRRGYEKTKLYHSEFDYVLEQPGKFREQTINLVNPINQATMFMVDDMVFKDFLALRTVPIKKLLSDDSIACVAIRMCPRINYCYTEKRETPPPKFTEDLMWFWKDSLLKGDWKYPMSADSSVFRTEDILPLLKNLSYENPNTLEGTLAAHPIDKPYMICYKDSLVFNIPVNKVQTANGNHCGNIPADYLNREFLKTKRISMSNIEFFKNTACHQEIPLILEDAVKYPVESFIKMIQDRAVDYTAITNSDAIVSNIDSSDRDINIFIPKKDREEFLEPCLSYLNKAILVSSRKIRVVILENDYKPKSQELCKKMGADYLFVPLDVTNTNDLMAKALMYNIGYLNTPRSSWNIFHDIDILVDEDYFIKLDLYFRKNPKWIQPYSKKRVLRLSEEITKRICRGETFNLSQLPEQHVTPANPGSPGGSVVVSSELFERVGGYDPELFYGYAPEDAFFWMKMECVFNRVDHTTTFFHGSATYADDPAIEIYHLNHDSLENINNSHTRMRAMLKSFLVFSYEDKKRLIDMKKDTFKKQVKDYHID